MHARLAFSTLACPHWSLQEVIANAQAMGYDGIEWRGGTEGHLQPALPRAERAALQRRMQEAGLVSLAVTSYTSFVFDDPHMREANVEQLKHHLDLASDIRANYVRAFLNEATPVSRIESAYPRIVDCLALVLPHARDVGVGIALEHHDDFIRTAALVPILDQLDDPLLGAVWDIGNAWSAGESPEEGIRNLGERIFYVQVKDGIGQRPHWHLTEVGQGEVPLSAALQLLDARNYGGWLSVEWEYAWHPELTPPESALPRALDWIREWMARKAANR